MDLTAAGRSRGEWTNARKGHRKQPKGVLKSEKMYEICEVENPY